jgi:hypothetical protein
VISPNALLVSQGDIHMHAFHNGSNTAVKADNWFQVCAETGNKSGNVQSSFRERSVNIQRIFSAHSGNVQVMADNWFKVCAETSNRQKVKIVCSHTFTYMPFLFEGE